jgi:hypothetical protein
MHNFIDLVEWGTKFTLNALNDAFERTVAELQTSGATIHVKSLQMIRYQKAILSVGMFSIFEAELQTILGGDFAFKEASLVLKNEGEYDLAIRFDDFREAINVLKHGRGRSYDNLVSRASLLPFRVRLPGEGFFYEGDVSEIIILIEVDDTFVSNCAEVINKVSAVIRRPRRCPDL